ncbi:hypothetical protein CMUS01_01640 [Colletotrichum musicola]|uniref:Uncharacterized protein n=1 Tax=Colletotrichum musicola TaxID=2175873 RepID=A0A8H6U7V8_9PEZI|nr:hypothetical protein CMUS01_01640 [Colletotrichum musicola]
MERGAIPYTTDTHTVHTQQSAAAWAYGTVVAWARQERPGRETRPVYQASPHEKGHQKAVMPVDSGAYHSRIRARALLIAAS